MSSKMDQLNTNRPTHTETNIITHTHTHTWSTNTRKQTRKHSIAKTSAPFCSLAERIPVLTHAPQRLYKANGIVFVAATAVGDVNILVIWQQLRSGISNTLIE